MLETVLFQTIQFSISSQFQYQKTVLFQTIQFTTNTQFSSIWHTEMTLSGLTTPGQSGHGSGSNDGILRIHQRSGITGAKLSDCLVSYTGYSLRES